MFVGFNVTFLIQHSAGLSGMPRRVYDYDSELGVTAYNLISTIGSFILGLGVLLTAVNVVISLKKGKRAGNDPWQGNTLEWFTSSPPPPNNFDVVPRVRSVEPMKDIRREVAAAARPAETVSQPAAPRSLCSAGLIGHPEARPRHRDRHLRPDHPGRGRAGVRLRARLRPGRLRLPRLAFCNGDVVPGVDLNSIVEYTHRVVAIVVGFMILALFVQAWRRRRICSRPPRCCSCS